MKEIDIKDLNYNAFSLKEDCALVTVKNNDDYDSMLISWGGFGSIWDRYATTIYLRPQRYTRNLLENTDYYTIEIYGKDNRKDLEYLGSHSKNEIKDKMNNISLTKVEEENYIYHKEAKIVLVCKKIYVNQMNHDSFINKEIDIQYNTKLEPSYMYIGEIIKILVNEN